MVFYLPLTHDEEGRSQFGVVAARFDVGAFTWG
jgi:hypothetical protein